MTRRIGGLLLVLIGCSPEAVGLSENAIIDGVPSDREGFVLVHASALLGDFVCSGTVIGEYAVLTARHCMTADDDANARYLPGDLTIQIGAHRARPERTLDVVELMLTGGETRNYAQEGRDLAVVIADAPLGITPIPLADALPTTGDPVTLIGFGERGMGARISGQRYEGATTVTDVYPFDPRSVYSALFNTNDGPAAACPGDSGGAVLDVSGRITGVISYGPSCESTRFNSHSAIADNRAFLDSALARVPGCVDVDPSEGCDTLDATPVVEAQIAGSTGHSLALVGPGIAISGYNRADVYTLPDLTLTFSDVGALSVSEAMLAGDGDTLAVGLRDELAIVSHSAGAYARDRSLAHSTTPDALALSGLALVVGERGPVAPPRPGAARVTLDYTTSAFEPLRADGPPSYGASVATDGSRLAVGAPAGDGATRDGGRAYLYERAGATWAETVVAAPDPVEADRFGQSVALFGDLFFVGAPGDDDVEGDAGAVYVFDALDPSAPPEVLYPERRHHGARFGESLAVDGDRLVVGAPGQGTGVVYVFARRASGEWGRVGHIAPASAALETDFGIALTLWGDRLAATGFALDSFSRPIETFVAVYDLAPATCIGTPTAPPPCVPPPAPDAGVPDAGADGGSDAGADTGSPDTGAPDTGDPDTGAPDTGDPRGGDTSSGGCGCRAAAGGGGEGGESGWLWLLVFGLALVAISRRRVRDRTTMDLDAACPHRRPRCADGPRGRVQQRQHALRRSPHRSRPG